MQASNGGPPLPDALSAEQRGRTRSLVLTASVCLASLAAVASLSGHRLLGGETPLTLSSFSASASEVVLEHHADAVRQGHATAAQLLQGQQDAAASGAAVLAAGPTIAEMAQDMTARAFAVAAAAPDRVQLLPQVDSLAPAEPTVLPEAASSDLPTAAADTTHPPDVTDGAAITGGTGPQPEQPVSPSASESGNAVILEQTTPAPREAAATTAAVGPLQPEVAVPDGAQADHAQPPGGPQLDAVLVSSQEGALQRQQDEQPGQSVVLERQQISPEDLQSAMAATAFAEDIVAGRAASADTTPTTTGSARSVLSKARLG